MTQKTVAIIHYNTPMLTECAIKSLRKHGGQMYRVVLFDNSDKTPFTTRMRGVEVIDNTKGQIINFERELAKFPHRDRTIGCAKGCEFGSAKHIMTVQKLWELIPDGFVLMESDILLKANIDEFFNEEYSVYGYWQKSQPHNPFGIGRMLPMLCWMNVPMLTKEGARYFDHSRTYGLLEGGRANRNNWYDTGAVLLEDILNARPRLKGHHVDIRNFVEHYGSASWANNDEEAQWTWLVQRRKLWFELENKRVAICAIGRMENRYAVEWVQHYERLGVDKIYIYDNNHLGDGELFADILGPWIEAGLVEIIYWVGNQKSAYEDCYRKHQSEFAWIGYFDFDELVEISGDRSIPELLEGFNYADVLALNWRVMTDNGLTKYEDKPMKERFTEGTGEDFGINRHVKSFVHGGIEGLTMNDPHVPCAPKGLLVVNVRGVRVEQKPLQAQVIHDVARVDHYDTKSTEEWLRKVKRGWCDVNASAVKQRQQHAIDYYFSINRRTLEKETLLGVVPPPSFDESQGTPIVKATKPSKPKAAKRTNKKQK